MVEKIPWLMIPLVNEVFDLNIAEDTPVKCRMNEHLKIAGGKIITDSCVDIGNRVFHVECQTYPDGTIAIRMLEYDFWIAMQDMREQEDKKRRDRKKKSKAHWSKKQDCQDVPRGMHMYMPHSCIIYLRHTRNTPEREEITIHFPDGSQHLYSVPVIKLQEYTTDELIQKRLYILMPYSILKYEKKYHEIENNTAELQKLEQEFHAIVDTISQEMTEDQKIVMKELTIRIIDYVARRHPLVRKEVSKIMGGQVLELEWEKKLKLGQEIGQEIGQKIGEEIGKEIGEKRGEQKFAELTQRLIQEQRQGDLLRATQEVDYRNQLYQEYGIE